MKIIRSDEQFIFESRNVIALGNFDGLHIAHKQLILTAVRIAEENNLKSVVYIFDSHPVTVTRNTQPRLITDFEQKIEIISSLGVDYIYLQKFDTEFSMLKPEIFIKYILKRKLSCAHTVSGFDYKFGYMAQGDTVFLKDFCNKENINVTVLERIDYLGEPVSASRIRNLLGQGDIQYVNELLGRKYQIRGIVEKGKSIGSSIGFPTANILLTEDMQMPAFGVYQTITTIDDIKYKSITNIGNNPTVNDKNTNITTCETHLIDTSEINLYGKKIYVDFIKMIRKEQRYQSLEMLKKAITEDILLVKSFDE
ncbi:MAG TPA: bifunctional riboflavin kinase/FAD synthetase [Clostridia bacterium]|nr:bifunctional riboflavin kinase/FAD synthetase [Clostridia bacterium]